MTNNKLPWFYLAHGYTTNPKKSIIYAHETANRFRRLGCSVESPVENSHYTHTWLLKQRLISESLSAMPDEAESQISYPIIDYVAANIFKIKAMMKGDAEECGAPGITLFCGHDCKICEKYRYKDSQIVMALDPSVIKMPVEIQGIIFNKQHPSEYYKALIDLVLSKEEWEKLWKSKGCLRDFQFCHHNHILIIDAPRFLHFVEKFRHNFFKNLHGWKLINHVIELYPEVKLF